MTKFNLKPVCERFFSIMALIFCNKISLSNTLKVFHKERCLYSKGNANRDTKNMKIKQSLHASSPRLEDEEGPVDTAGPPDMKPRGKRISFFL